MNFKGKKGDSVHIPSPTRGNASVKTAQNQVTLIAATESEVIVTIDKHYEYSRLIEDIVEAQALSSLRNFYTEDAGYALARQVDTDLIQLGRGVQGGSGTNAYSGAFSGADGTTAYVAGTNTGFAALTDAAIRRSIQRLDDQDVVAGARETFRRRRATSAPTQQLFKSLFGLEVSPRMSREAANFWKVIREQDGVSARDKIWSSLLPTPEDLLNPQNFLKSTEVPDDLSSL